MDAAVDSMGNVYISDVGNSRLLENLSAASADPYADPYRDAYTHCDIYPYPDAHRDADADPDAVNAHAIRQFRRARRRTHPTPTPDAARMHRDHAQADRAGADADSAAGPSAYHAVQSPVLAGANFTIKGSGFTKGSEVNFFVSTSSGPINEGTAQTPAATSATQLTVPVPATITLGQGFVSVVVVNTDEGFVQSNPGFALLQGSAAAGLPSITGLDGHPLAATSLDPDFAVANVETTLLQGSSVVINGNGFDTVHGVAVDVFCACPGGKLPTSS